MKRWIILSVVLSVVALGGSGLEAETKCLDFDDFCDSMTLTDDTGSLEGTWNSYDCAGSSDVLSGPLVGNGTGRGRVVCGAGGFGTCLVSGSDIEWGFVFDTQDGTMDMLQSTDGGATWQIWIDELAYTFDTPECGLEVKKDAPYGSLRTNGFSE